MWGMRKLVRRWYLWVLALLVALWLGWNVFWAVFPPWTGTEAWEKYQSAGIGKAWVEVDGGWPAEWTQVGDKAVWSGGEDQVDVTLDGQGRVVRKSASIRGHHFSEPPNNWWDSLRARLGW
jgi:hypothetical protein